MLGFCRKMAQAREEPVTGQIEPEEPKGTIFMSAGLVDTLFLVSEIWNIRYWTALQLNSCSQRLWFEREHFFIVLHLDDAKVIRSLQCNAYIWHKKQRCILAFLVFSLEECSFQDTYLLKNNWSDQKHGDGPVRR